MKTATRYGPLTLGPERNGRFSDTQRIDTKDGIVGEVSPEYARLFAAAPDLLAACKFMVSHARCRLEESMALERIEVAIAKAEATL